MNFRGVEEHLGMPISGTRKAWLVSESGREPVPAK